MLGKGCPTLIVGCSISMPFDRFGPRRDIPRMYANVACGHPAFGEVLAFAFFKENRNVLIGLRVRAQKKNRRQSRWHPIYKVIRVSAKPAKV